MLDKYKIIMTGHGKGEVFRNGERVENVRAVQFNGGIDLINTVTLTLNVGEVEIEAEADGINV